MFKNKKKSHGVLCWGTPIASTPVVCLNYYASVHDMTVHLLKEGIFSDIKNVRITSSSVSLNRNKLWHAAKEMNADYHLQVDIDGQFKKDSIDKLLELEKVMPDCMYVGLCMTGGDPWAPAIWLEDEETGRGQILYDFPREKPFEVHLAGGYFFLIPRSILYSDKMPDNPFKQIGDHSEDQSFCKRVRQAGFKIICHPGVKIGHLRLMPMVESHWDAAKLKLDPKEYVSIKEE